MPDQARVSTRFAAVLWAALRSIVPLGARRIAHILRQLPPTARPEYLRWFLSSRLGSLAPLPDPVAIRTVVFVCHGNIMRSPMAAALLTRQLAQHGAARTTTIASAGLHTQRGAQPPALALEAAAAFGVSLAEHRSLPLATEVVDSADILLVMDLRNAAELSSRWPGARPKVRLLGRLAANGKTEILDPYGTDLATTMACYRQIADATEVLATTLETAFHR